MVSLWLILHRNVIWIFGGSKPMQFSENSRQTERVFQITSSLLVSMMMACVAVTVVLLIQRYNSDFWAVFLPFVSFFVVLERLLTYQRVKKLQPFSRPWLIWISSQWVVILIVIKISVLLSQDLPPLKRLLQLWQLDFFTYFFDLDYMLPVIFMLIVWLFGGVVAGLLDEMSLDEMAILFETAVQAPSDRPPARQRLISLMFVIGIVVVATTALMRVNLRMLLTGNPQGLDFQPLPYLAAGAWNVLLYFVLLLILLSQTQLSRLNSLWSIRKITVEPRLVSRWIASSLGFIVILALIASLLPTNYSLSLLSVIRYLGQLIYFVVLFLFSAVLSLVVLLFNLLMSLLARESEAPPLTQPTPVTPIMPEMVEAIPGEPLPWLALVRSLVFWLAFLGIIGFSLYQYLRQHENLLQAMRKIPGLRWLVNAWKWLTGGFQSLNRHLGERVRTGLDQIRVRRAQRRAEPLGRFANFRGLSPRQKVLFFFFALTQRGAQHGLPRKASQTPYEYAASLEQAFPEMDEDLEALTTAFVTARYSRSKINETQAGLVKQYWDRIRKAIRKTIQRSS